MSTLSIHKFILSKVSKNLVAGLLSTAILSGTALADYIPPALAVPSGHVLYKKLHVKDGYGSQNFVCVQNANGDYAWHFYGPQATLLKNDSQAATHFLSVNVLNPTLPDGSQNQQPTWQDSDDSSRVWAAAIASVKPADDPLITEKNAINWLLLEVKGKKAGPTGGNNLLKTTYIQRINTVGGVTPDPTKPESLCDSTHNTALVLNNVSTRFLVPYETDYLFYKLAN